MNILVMSQYFWPETFIIQDLVDELTAQGHSVTVATGKPNYPQGELFPGYSIWSVQREKYRQTVDVVRVPLWPRHKGGAVNLIANYLSFVVSGCLLFPWLLRKRRFDHIFVFAPSPITQVVPAILIKWIKGASLSLWVQDLWPQSLAATGFVRNRRALALVGWFVRHFYAACDVLFAQSHSFVDQISRYASADKIHYLPNGFTPPTAEQKIPLNAESDAAFCCPFNIVFAGNIGTAQSMETLVSAAEILREDKRIRIVLVGSGSVEVWVKEELSRRGLSNVVLVGRHPQEMMPSFYEKASALLVMLKNEPIFSQTVPSKVQAYLAAGKPIIACMNGEGARIVRESGAGVTCPAEDAEQLAASILYLSGRSADERDQMGRAGSDYFVREFTMASVAGRLLSVIESVARESA